VNDGGDLNQADLVEVKHREVAIERVLTELTRVNEVDEEGFKSDFLRLRLEVG